MAISICISPQGNDKNSGGSEDPFASLNRAQQEIRSLINAFEEGQEQDIDVHLSGGIHRISKTLVLGRNDSGTSRFSVNWKGSEKEKTVVSSGYPLTGWQRLEDEPDELTQAVRGRVWFKDLPRSADYNDYVPELTGFDDHGKNWHPPTEEADAGVLYQRLIKTTCNGLIALENDHINWEIAGFIWVQGEHEAGISPSMASDYGMLLQRFIGAVREDFSCSGLPVLIAGLNSHSWSFADPVRQGQKALCDNDSHAVLVDTTDISRYGSGGAAHFDATGMLTLGERFADHFVRTTTSK